MPIFRQTVNSYSKNNNISESKVMEMIEAEELDGVLENNVWYVRINKDNEDTANNQNESETSLLSIVFYFLGLLAIVLGIYISSTFWPSNIKTDVEQINLYISMGILIGGIIQGSILIAVGLGLAYLKGIYIRMGRIKNT